MIEPKDFMHFVNQASNLLYTKGKEPAVLVLRPETYLEIANWEDWMLKPVPKIPKGHLGTINGLEVVVSEKLPMVHTAVVMTWEQWLKY